MWKTLTPFILLLMSTMGFAQTADKLVIDLNSLKKPNWTEQELNNAVLITDFVQNLMNNHDFDYILERYNNSAYVQHNRNLPNKIEGLVGFLEEFVEEYPDYTYDVKHIYVDGNYVIFHSHATLNQEDRGNDQKGLNIIDTWRVEEGRIVEHWDSIQALDFSMRFYSLISGGDINNSNGVF
ncbi:nuclear transport factor 2 family protein [Photobacterium sp. 1_MG-2023]|uniref:nuclear transport factor 2 family protein n=1 Tax=Photobacterium sp. 1_MG-2023 TaxID=3062646 RepID=UPI0026E38396|nr:nuclear transport factor 2 family protein [Photobacterium sp. 1_MG-2023]MDO6706952.1 nuclear transport factor 2 family protein [Photobacterium sp. 1_MG-2023]